MGSLPAKVITGGYRKSAIPNKISLKQSHNRFSRPSCQKIMVCLEIVLRNSIPFGYARYPCGDAL